MAKNKKQKPRKEIGSHGETIWIGHAVSVPVDKIVFNKNNPRNINTKQAGFLELVQSVKRRGVLIPVHVRELPKGKFELLAGERRVKAAQVAGVAEVPALNHGKLGDAEAFEITFTENFAREDLSPLEQGQAVAVLLDKYKGDSEAVASKLGKSVRWVRQRQAITTKLCPEWKKALADEPEMAYWTAGHLQLVASLPVETQKDLLLEYGGSLDYLPSIDNLEGQIAEMLTKLAGAPFDTGTCLKCQKRTAAQPGLFDDTEEPEKLKANDRCLDVNCYATKTAENAKALFDAAQKKWEGKLVPVTTSDPHGADSRALSAVFDNYASPWEYKQAGKDEKGAVPGFIIHGKARGTVLWVKAARDQRDAKGTKRKAGQPTPLKTRRALLEKKRGAALLGKLQPLVEKTEVRDVTTKEDKDRALYIMALANVFGVEQRYEHNNYDFQTDLDTVAPWTKFEKLIKADRDTIIKTLWENIRPVLVRCLSYNGPITQTTSKRIKAAEKLAALCQIDVKGLRKQIEGDMPEPKSWANLNPDGTKKEAKKPGKKQTPKKKTKKAATKKKSGKGGKTE